MAGLPAGLSRLLVVHGLQHCPATLAGIVAVLVPARSFFWLHDHSLLCAGHRPLRNDTPPCGAPPPHSTACRICVYGPGRPAYLAACAEALEVWQRGGGLPHRPARVIAPRQAMPGMSACRTAP